MMKPRLQRFSTFSESFGGQYSLVPSHDSRDKRRAGRDATCSRRFAESTGFQTAVGFLILLNGVVVGAETDDPGWPYWDHVENTFLLLFLGELILRIAAIGWASFLDWAGNPDFAWNLYDLVVVAVGCCDALLSCLRGSSGHSVATTFRVVRLLRIARLFRIVRYMRELYVLAYGILLSVVALFWVTILMALTLYVCSIVLVRTVGQLAEDHPDREFLQQQFGSIFQAMFTLFNLMIDPDLHMYFHVFQEVDQLVLTGFVVVFVIFGSFGMTAVLAGVMQEGMFQKNLVRQQQEQEERDTRNRKLLNRCSELFDELPQSSSGEASIQAVTEVLPSVALLFESVGVPFVREDLHTCLAIMDVDFSGEISKQEFCHFLLQLSEGVRPILLLELRHSISECLRAGMAETRRGLEELRAASAASAELLQQAARRSEAERQELQRQVQRLLEAVQTPPEAQKGAEVQRAPEAAQAPEPRKGAEVQRLTEAMQVPESPKGVEAPAFAGGLGDGFTDDFVELRTGLEEQLQKVADEVRAAVETAASHGGIAQDLSALRSDVHQLAAARSGAASPASAAASRRPTRTGAMIPGSSQDSLPTLQWRPPEELLSYRESFREEEGTPREPAPPTPVTWAQLQQQEAFARLSGSAPGEGGRPRALRPGRT